MSDGPLAFDAVREDLLVAAAAALSAVGLTVALAFGAGVSVGPLRRIAPLSVYFVYLFFGKGDTGSRLEDPRPWAALSVAVAAGVLVAAVA